MTGVDSQYANLLKEILFSGYEKDTRAGKTLSVFGHTMRFDMSEGLPILTTKKVAIKGVIEELLWFLRGESNIRPLVEHNVNIWTDDAYRHYKKVVTENNECVAEYFPEGEFDKCEVTGPFPILSKEAFVQAVKDGEEMILFYKKKPIVIRGVTQAPSRPYGQRQYRCGDLGPVYGVQWRRFGDSKTDQLMSVVESLRNNPDDRRMLVVAYNPDVLDQVALPPCHVMFQVYSRELTMGERLTYLPVGDEDVSTEHLDELGAPRRGISLMWTQRSVDVPLGLAYNITSYAILLHILANMVNMRPLELIASLGDCHIYKNQIEGVQEQLQREGADHLPKLKINFQIDGFDNLEVDDFIIEGYESDPPIKFPLSVG